MYLFSVFSTTSAQTVGGAGTCFICQACFDSLFSFLAFSFESFSTVSFACLLLISTESKSSIMWSYRGEFEWETSPVFFFHGPISSHASSSILSNDISSNSAISLLPLLPIHNDHDVISNNNILLFSYCFFCYIIIIIIHIFIPFCIINIIFIIPILLLRTITRKIIIIIIITILRILPSILFLYPIYHIMQ